MSTPQYSVLNQLNVDHKQDMQRTCNVILRRVYETIVVVEKQ